MFIQNFIILSLKRNEYGISAVVRQTVTLRETEQINDRIFDISEFFTVSHLICLNVYTPPQCSHCVL